MEVPKEGGGTNTRELSFLLMFKCDFMGVCGMLLE
jgi:hypothetical protein